MPFIHSVRNSPNRASDGAARESSGVRSCCITSTGIAATW
jgi:hypothetical protein